MRDVAMRNAECLLRAIMRCSDNRKAGLIYAMSNQRVRMNHIIPAFYQNIGKSLRGQSKWLSMISVTIGKCVRLASIMCL